MALPKINRLSLLTSKEIFLGGKKFHSNYFTLVKSMIYDPTSTGVRFAIVVSKKVARKAHDRHKIRRLTSSAIFEQINKFPTGYYLVHPKGSLLNTSYTDILTDLSTIINKL